MKIGCTIDYLICIIETNKYKTLKTIIMITTTNSVHVSQKYRTNSLSHQPGGHTIAVILKNGFKLIYDRIKYPENYARAIHGDDIAEVIIMN